jgi:hypothetical protein
VTVAAEMRAVACPGGRAASPAWGDRPRCPVSVGVIAGMVLANARESAAESVTAFAARAGVPRLVVAGVEDGGDCPAWALDQAGFDAIDAAVGAHDLDLSALFETGAACDWLLTCVLGGGLPGAACRVIELPRAAAVLRWAVRGEPPAAGSVRLRPAVPLLLRAQLARLQARAGELAASRPAKAAVGAHLLALFGAPAGMAS